MGWISKDAAGQHSKKFTMLVHQLEADELSELLKVTHNPAWSGRRSSCFALVAGALFPGPGTPPFFP